MGSRAKGWDLPFVEAFALLDCHLRRNGKWIHATEKALRKGMGSWWPDGYTYRAKSVSEWEM